MAISLLPLHLPRFSSPQDPTNRTICARSPSLLAVLRAGSTDGPTGGLRLCLPLSASLWGGGGPLGSLGRVAALRLLGGRRPGCRPHRSAPRSPSRRCCRFGGWVPPDQPNRRTLLLGGLVAPPLGIGQQGGSATVLLLGGLLAALPRETPTRIPCCAARWWLLSLPELLNRNPLLLCCCPTLGDLPHRDAPLQGLAARWLLGGTSLGSAWQGVSASCLPGGGVGGFAAYLLSSHSAPYRRRLRRPAGCCSAFWSCLSAHLPDDSSSPTAPFPHLSSDKMDKIIYIYIISICLIYRRTGTPRRRSGACAVGGEAAE